MSRVIFKLLGLAVVGLLLTGPLNFFTSEKAIAASASSFDPGLLISDSNFYDGASMSEAEIQAFLVAKVGRCANSNCLANYKQDTPTTSWSFGTCRQYQGESGESAARIIYKVQVACGLSAKVLLTTLQKEQSLITDSAPSNSKMQKALGQGCPDTADCDKTYASFFMQVYSSARQLTWYGNPNGEFTYIRVGAVRNVLFHPNVNCGFAPIKIKNRATAALYYYTPYQPNSAALANLYGEGDGCSAYGNRNFWRIYSDWFGSPIGSPYVNLDSATGVWGGVTVRGWARSASDDSTQFLWVNIDGEGGPIAANRDLPWFSAYFGGYTNFHGFDDFFPASPGGHEVCVYFTNWVDCRYVVVPRGMGALDQVEGVRGGVRVSGWSLDALTLDHSYIWVNVDGQGGAYPTNLSFPWIPLVARNASPNQGFSHLIPASPGLHQVCIYGSEAKLGCREVEVPAGLGALDAVNAVQGGALIEGWFVDYTRTDYSYIWISVDGGPSTLHTTNKDLPWLEAYVPGAGTHHGFSTYLPLQKGSHDICVTGHKILGCKKINVITEYAGSVDVIESVPGGIRLSGWLLKTIDQKAIAYPWVTINGVGLPLRADKNVNWLPALFPTAGSNHGFDDVVRREPGWYNVCVQSDVLMRCQVINVVSNN